MIALLSLSILGFSFVVFHDKAKIKEHRVARVAGGAAKAAKNTAQNHPQNQTPEKQLQ